MMPMDLLVQYAENFYRRFPEEFMALGAPGLEEAFDLRPHSRLRRVEETFQDKTVEITIRRWPSCSQAACGGLPFGGMPPQQQQFGRFAPPPASMGHPCYYQQAQTQPGSSCGCGHGGGLNPPSASLPADLGVQVAQAVAMVEEQAGGRLQRLEGALHSLKQQIEVLLAQQMAVASANTAAMGAGIPAATALLRSPLPEQQSSLPTQGVSPQNPPMQQHRPSLVPTPPLQPTHYAQPFQGVQQQPPALGGRAEAAPTNEGDEDNELRVRRHMVPLQITTMPSIDKATFTTPGSQAAVVKLNEGESEDAVEVPQKATERERPRVSVSTVRVAPGAHDPASPRSPGRYSVWKS